MIKFISISAIQPPLDGVKSPCTVNCTHPAVPTSGTCASYSCSLYSSSVSTLPQPPAPEIQASLKKLHVTCSLFLSLAQVPKVYHVSF